MTAKKPRKKKKRKGHYQRGEYTSSKTGQVCKFRSGWEEKMMYHLDSDPNVKTWTYEQTVIEYVSNIRTKKIRRYYPDFLVEYVDGRSEVVEVKPKRKLEQSTIKKKTAAAILWCSSRGINFRLVTEDDLKEMGLL